MPRGRKRLDAQSIQDQMADIDAQLVEIDNKKSELKAKKKELQDKLEKQAIAQFLEAAKSAGKTPVELIAELSAKDETAKE